MSQFNGLDHPFKVGEQQLSIDNDEFQLDVKTDMPYVILYTFNQPKTGKVMQIFIKHIRV